MRTALTRLGSQAAFRRTNLSKTRRSAQSRARFYSTAKPVLITTPIYYVNGPPHIGHLYSTLLADALARWFRLTGHQVKFTTGTDEHGLKIQETADKHHVSVQKWCDDVSQCFKALYSKAGIQYDDYIRTTEDRHKKAVNRLWNILNEGGYIYEGKFEGWYSVSDETFLTPHQVMDVTDPSTGVTSKVSMESGHKVTWLTEPNYMFKMSQFREKILDWIAKEHPIHPPGRRDEIVADLERGLRDLSVSRIREKIPWGIPVPTDPSHVIYVWLDALTNYLTVSGFPDDPNWRDLWPADYHIVGKDIIKFHTIYWPSFLMAANLPLPKKVIAHAHWTMNKEKMSKSKGNVVDPNELLDQYGVDPVRYYLLRESWISHDGDFSYENVNARLVAELADTLGNLFTRCAAPALNPTEGKWPSFRKPTEEQIQLAKSLEELPDQVDALYRECEFGRAIVLIFDNLRAINKHFAVEEPWKLVPKKAAGLSPAELETRLERLETIVYLALEAVRISCSLLLPVMPSAMLKVVQHLEIPSSHLNPLAQKFGYEYSQHIPVSPLGKKKAPVLFVKPLETKTK